MATQYLDEFATYTDQELLLIFYNQRAIIPVKAEDYYFDKPVIYEGMDSTRNTRVFLRPKAETGFYGKITIFYNRIDLTAQNFSMTVTVDGELYLSELLPQINERYGLRLRLSDIIDIELPPNGTFNLVASADSLLFTGLKVVTIA